MSESYAKSEFMIRAAWMYYIGGQNQNEIAAELGVSRPVVQRLIAAAKDEGVITVGIHHPIATCLDYAELIKAKYQLTHCLVVPASREEDMVRNVAFGGAQMMAQCVGINAVHSIGIGSGMTLKKAVEHFQPTADTAMQCVALISAMAMDGQCNYYDDVPLILARRVKAKYYQWPAPRYSRSLEDHALWCDNALYHNVTAKADASDVIFVGVGALGEDSPIIKDGFISREQGDALLQAGAAGEILGRFIDTQGQVVNHEINDRITSYDIRRCSNARILVAGGREKQVPTLSALRGGWVNGLVIDEDNAKWLLTQ
ncbi:cytochrome C biogenesis protein CcdA [Photobacterium japonica]|uniref:sugar-binding transcriptional regulator n=1 Tax=Photobacterium japonica TaxID=2910235 RepID=UPI003D0B43CA